MPANARDERDGWLWSKAQRRPTASRSLPLLALASFLPAVGFGVVVCPNCRWPKGVDLSTKSSRCTRCSRGLNLRRLRVWARVEQATQLPEAVGEVAEQLQAGLDPRELPSVEDLITRRPAASDLESTLAAVDRKREAHASQTSLEPLTLALRAVAVSGARSKWECIVQLVRELGRVIDDIPVELIERGLEKLGILELPTLEGVDLDERDQLRQAHERALAKWLERLSEANVVYAPRAGVYRLP